MESLLIIVDNLEPWLRRINMWHRRNEKPIFDQIILSFELQALYREK